MELVEDTKSWISFESCPRSQLPPNLLFSSISAALLNSGIKISGLAQHCVSNRPSFHLIQYRYGSLQHAHDYSSKPT